MLKKTLCLFLCILFAAVLSAQEADADLNESAIKPPQDFFIGLNGGVSLYSAYEYAYGGGLIIGYGTGSAIGLNLSWYFGAEGINTLEFNFFLRFYLFGRNVHSGPYLKLMGGPVIFLQDGYLHIPANAGAFSGGLSFGWRFVFADKYFIEPYIRGGYPYLAGGGILAGIRL